MSRFANALVGSPGRAKGFRLAPAPVLYGAGIVLAVATIRTVASPEEEKTYREAIAQALANTEMLKLERYTYRWNERHDPQAALLWEFRKPPKPRDSLAPTRGRP